MKIAVAGVGYVGLSMAVLLSQHNEVVALDVVEDKVKMLNNHISPIKDTEIEDFLKNKKLNLKSTLNYKEAFSDADYVIISTPTNYDEEKNYFDTSSVELSIERVLEVNSNATIIIKSTIPVGFTKRMREKYGVNNIIFSPEFLREGHALYDNLYPSRIIVGDTTDKAKKFAELLKEGALKEKVDVKFMNSTEAEAVKLFSNTYLAMRVSFFNELDTYAEVKGLNAKDIIEGMGFDPRIGNYYNNPSFGYGGYCLPKDTKQLLANYDGVPEDMITAIVKSNETRKNYIAQVILGKNPNVVGIYRLTMKANSDNFRCSAIQSIMKTLSENNVRIVIFEPSLKSDEFEGYKVIKDFKEFADISDVILANRLEEELSGSKSKVYTRDLYSRD